MKAVFVLCGASVLAFAAPAAAQSMPGMAMPGIAMPHHNPPAKKAAVKKKKLVTRKTATATPTAPHQPLATSSSSGMAMPIPSQSLTPDMAMPPASAPSEQMPAMAMPGSPGTLSPTASMSDMDHGVLMGANHAMAMNAAFGAYPTTRESSGTAWQPDASRHSGVMTMAGDWMLMGHARLNAVYDWQGGPRGDDKGFFSGMLMGMAQRSVGRGTLQFRAMLSPDPLMGKRGYPLLLASGETADGITSLVDRQHPHDFFMELSASLSQPIGKDASLFAYAGLPGEPAFGPPAFMHREAILDSPEAPISHHWLDSTHISFGVLTGGLVIGSAKIELSQFNAREPDQYRWNIETGPLDSTAVRLSWNPTRELALQASWARFIHPEQLEPDTNQTRLSASALYARDIGPGHLATTLAWGRKSHGGRKLDAVALEMSYGWQKLTFFGRGEWTQNDELLPGITAKVGKLSIGAIRDFRLAPHVAFGLGGLVAQNFVPAPLATSYGGNRNGAMAFVRVKID